MSKKQDDKFKLIKNDEPNNKSSLENQISKQQTENERVNLAKREQLLKQIKNIFKKQVFLVQLQHNGEVFQQCQYNSLIKMMGGEILKKLSPRVTIVITNWRKGSFFNKVEKMKIPMVSIKWIEQCVQQKKKIPFYQFLIKREQKPQAIQIDIQKEKKQRQQLSDLIHDSKMGIMQISNAYEMFFKPKEYLKLIKQNSISNQECVVKIRQIDSIIPKIKLEKQTKSVPRISTFGGKSSKQIRISNISLNKKSNRLENDFLSLQQQNLTDQNKQQIISQCSKINQTKKQLQSGYKTIQFLLQKYSKASLKQNYKQSYKQNLENIIDNKQQQKAQEAKQLSQNNCLISTYSPKKQQQKCQQLEIYYTNNHYKQSNKFTASLDKTYSFIKNQSNQIFNTTINQKIKVYCNDPMIKRKIMTFNQRKKQQYNQIYLDVLPFQNKEAIYIASNSKIDQLLGVISKCNTTVSINFISKLSKIQKTQSTSLQLLTQQCKIKCSIRSQFIKGKKITVLYSINQTILQYIIRYLGGFYIPSEKYFQNQLDIIITNRKDSYNNNYEKNKVISQCQFIDRIFRCN